MKYKFKLVLTILMGLMIFDSHAQDPNFYIFLSFGQSNMEGNPSFEEEDIQVSSRFKVLEAVDCPNLGREMGQWYTAVPPLCRCKTGLTPSDYFGRTLVESLPDSITIGVINVSIGGCKIELFDRDNYENYKASAPSWMMNMINEYQGNPYGRLVEMARLAQKDGVIKGILLHQGESNVDDKDWPEKVKTVYHNLLQDLDLELASIPLLAGELVDAEQGGKCAPMNEIIRTLPMTIPNSYVISSKDCEAKPDQLHFSAAGCRKLGKRYGEKMLALLGY